MNPAWLALVSPASALLGVIIGQWAAMQNDRLKWEREQRVRHNELRIQAYTDLSRFADAMAYAALRRANGEPDIRLAGRDYDELVDAFHQATEHVDVLGGEDVRAAAARLVAAANALYLDPLVADPDSVYAAVRPLRDMFKAAVRKELRERSRASDPWWKRLRRLPRR